MAAPVWQRIPCKISELRLDRTLACGQSFRWKEHETGEWTGVIGDNVWRLRQTNTHLQYQVYTGSDNTATHNKQKCGVSEPFNEVHNLKSVETKDIKPLEDSCKAKTLHTKPQLLKSGPAVTGDLKCRQSCEDILTDYFQLEVKLEQLYKEWSAADSHFAEVSQNFTGIRMIRQDPVECLFSFICSSNNNISRITSMVDKLAAFYGKKIMTLDGETYFRFPHVSALAVDGVEEKLRSLGFGYRAKYIQTSARYIQEHGGEDWLYSLRGQEYDTTKSQLIKLCGVGAKVADCVALFSLDKPGSVPVDTHVWQIAARDYLPKLKQAKTLTDTLYREIGDHFRTIWGPYAGWAHSVMFTADLKKFKDNKVDTISPSKRQQSSPSKRKQSSPSKREHSSPSKRKQTSSTGNKNKSRR